MFKVLGKPPSSDYIEVAEKDTLYVPTPDTGRAKLFMTQDRKLKAVWSDGVTSEFTTTALSYLASLRNRVINGDFQIWQRGTSATGVTSGYRTADRWEILMNTGSLDLSKSTMNGWNSLKATVNTTADLSVNTAYLLPFQYKFEGQHLYDINKKGSNITVSFLFRSNVTGTFCVVVKNMTNPGVQIESYAHEFQYTTSGSAQKIIFTVPFARSFNPALQNNSSLGIQLDIASITGSAYQTSTVDSWVAGNFYSTPNAVNWASSVGNYVEIAQVQVEEGDTATDFEVVPYDIQLLRCMRYYEKSYPYNDYAGSATLKNVELLYIEQVTGDVGWNVRFKVVKRATPTVTVYSRLTGAPGKIYRSPTGDLTANLGGVGDCGFYVWESDNSASLVNDYFHWIADAEL